MQRIMFKSKIHRARITEANLYYEGSITIDRDLMEAADLLPYEQVSVVNINNGERFETYVIEGEKGSKDICLNGAAARKGAVGDEIIIISYGNYSEDEIGDFEPTIILVDEFNTMVKCDHEIKAHTVYAKP